MTLAFILLAQFVGLSTAQNLFYVALLLTPVPLPSATAKRSSLWTPHPAVYIVPLVVSMLLVDLIPYGAAETRMFQVWRFAYFAVPLLFALGVQVRFYTKRVLS
jgi:hypothetical protein